MQLIKKLEIQSKYKIIEFLNSEPVGRIASLDPNGFPQVIPMNFVFVQANDPRVHSRRIIKLDAVYLTIFIQVTLRKLILSTSAWLSKETQ